MASANKKNSSFQPSIKWSANLYDTKKKFHANSDYTWFMAKNLVVNQNTEFSIKVGNKDYALDLESTSENKQKISEFALKKKHG